MSALHVSVINAFKQMGWEYHVVPGLAVVEARFEAHHTKVFLHVQSHEEAGIVSVVANATHTVPTSHLRSASELLMRTNKELNLGNFEVDWDSGQVMFRVSNVFAKMRVDERVIASMVHTSVGEMDRLTPYLHEVCKRSPAELVLLSIPELMAREDLLPPAPEGVEIAAK
jgi:hypothetical protein